MSDPDARPTDRSVGPDGRYVLVRQVGSGATGTVHEARDTVLGRRVAVKLIDQRLAADPVFHRRVVNEAEVLARLDGRAIVRVYDFGEADEGMYLVTQYLPDGDLGAWVSQRGPLTARDAALVVADVCDALDEAHRAGIVHRDVKPGNVLVRAGDAGLDGYLADFGIARPDDSDLTTTGQVLGTVRYMAPEQHEGARASATGDIYSAGCVLWFALTGRPPYDGTQHQQAVGHIDGPVPQLSETGLGWANAILARSMAKDPAERFATAHDMAAALRAAAADAPRTALAAPDGTLLGTESTDETTVPDPPTSRPRRTRLALVGAGLVLAVVAGGATWAAYEAAQDQPAAEQWRCGDGSVVDSSSACAVPSGVNGLPTVFPASRGCQVNTANADKNYAVSCTFAGPPRFSVTYSAWPSHQTALDHYRAAADKAPPGEATPTPWELDGEQAGLTWDLRTRLKASFLYDALDYSVSVNSDTEAGLEKGMAYVERVATPPSELVPRRID